MSQILCLISNFIVLYHICSSTERSFVKVFLHFNFQFDPFVRNDNLLQILYFSMDFFPPRTWLRIPDTALSVLPIIFPIHYNWKSWFFFRAELQEPIYYNESKSFIFILANTIRWKYQLNFTKNSPFFVIILHHIPTINIIFRFKDGCFALKTNNFRKIFTLIIEMTILLTPSHHRSLS